MNTTEISSMITYLFDRYWDEDLSDKEIDKLEQDAEDLVSEYGWEHVYPIALDYLHNKCIAPQDIINFASNYWTYGWYDHPIPDPYAFLGYLYYRINFETAKYDPMDILDSLATTILPKAGYRDADLYLNPYYMPESDPKIIRAVEEYRKKDS